MAIVGRRYAITGEGYSTIGQITHTGGQPDVPLEQLPAADGPLRRRRGQGRRARRRPDRGRARRPRREGRRRPDAHPRAVPARRDAAVRRGLQAHGDVPPDEGRRRARTSSGPTSRARRTSSSPGPRPPTGPTASRSRSTRSATTYMAENERLGTQGLRVMATGQKDFDPATFDAERRPAAAHRRDLTLLALVGIVDPPRPEAKDAIAKAHAAGIQVRMITGDHAVTAEAIASQLGIKGRAITGAEFVAMSDDEAMRRDRRHRRHRPRRAGGQGPPRGHPQARRATSSR